MLCFCENKMNLIEINKTLYYACSNCGYLRKKHIPNQIEEKNRYDAHVCDEGYISYMNNVFLKLKPYLNNGKSLDYGCGQIHALSDIMNNNGYYCDYYDLYYYDNIIDKKYDNIILIEVFEHVENVYELLLKLKNMLNNNGQIIIMTKEKVVDLNNWWYLRDITHISFVEYKTMALLASMLKLKLNYDKDNSLFIFSSI